MARRSNCPPEPSAAETFCVHARVLTALARYSSPLPGVRAAHEAEPALAVRHLKLQDSLQLTIRTVVLEAVPRD